MIYTKLAVLTALVTLLGIFPGALALLQINEIMYAPSEAAGGASNEWLELALLGNGSFNLSSCTIDGREFSSQNMSSGEFLVLARNPAAFQQLYPDVPFTAASLSLRNDEDDLFLNCSFGQESIHIQQSLGAYRNNHTLERRAEGSWGESIIPFGTPGKANSITNLSLVYGPLFISEFFPDPFGADDAVKPLGEWVELQNDGSHPLWLGGLYFTSDDPSEELFITDSTTLEDLILDPGEYIVIYREGDSDFALKNDGIQVIRLWAGDELIHEVSYTGSTMGMSWSNIEGDFFQTPPTPGEINEFFEDCDWLLDIGINSSISRPEDFFFDVTVSRFLGIPQNVSVQGILEDEFGRIVQEYHPWTNQRVTDLRTQGYSPNLREGVYQLRFWFTQLDCSDADINDNNVSRLFAINRQYQAFTPSLSIGKISLGSDDKAEWGEQLRIPIQIYKGNSGLSIVNLWAEQGGKKITKEVKLTVDEPFQNLSLALPLLLPASCDTAAHDGIVTVVVDGLGTRAEESFQVTGVGDGDCTFPEPGSLPANQKFSLEILPISSALPGSTIPLTAILTNDGQRHAYEVWSYIYRGSKCYSCSADSREANVQRRNLQSGEAHPFTFLLPLPSDLEPGDYKVKVQVRKDQQKTLKEATVSLAVWRPSVSGNTSLPLLSARPSTPLLLLQQPDLSSLPSSGFIVYQTNAKKSGELAPYILGLAFLILLVTLLRKK